MAEFVTADIAAAEVQANLAAVKARIATAAREVGREPAEVTLVAVTKTHSAATAGHAIAAGQRVFGENRVQEAQDKFPDLKATHADLELHLIGPLQTNKVKQAVALFDVIETVDRESLAEALAKEIAKTGRRPAWCRPGMRRVSASGMY